MNTFTAEYAQLGSLYSGAMLWCYASSPTYVELSRVFNKYLMADCLQMLITNLFVFFSGQKTGLSTDTQVVYQPFFLVCEEVGFPASRLPIKVCKLFLQVLFHSKALPAAWSTNCRWRSNASRKSPKERQNMPN